MTLKPNYQLMTAAEMHDTLDRLAEEILIAHAGRDLVLVGIQRRGVPMAQRMAQAMSGKTHRQPQLGILDINLYRDDLTHVAVQPIVRRTELPSHIDDKDVILIDDVLYTGRTVGAALRALTDFGRMRTIQLAVFVDRGHRELPVEANFTGRKIATKDNEVVEVRLCEIDGEDAIYVMGKSVKRKDLLGIRELDCEEILEILDTADSMQELSARPIKKVPVLRGKTIINLFFEASTRTRTSFEIAGKWLSADVVNISMSTSSVSKGETLIDTARTLDSMSADCVVIRHSSAGAPQTIARMTKARVINGGDGAHEHPTQALLDAMTIRRRKGTLAGLKVAIVGDIAHSRVARSNIHLLTKFGSDVWVCAAPTLMPVMMDELLLENGGRLHRTHSMDEALDQADVIMMLRVQFERMNESFFPSVREYFRYYGLSRDRASRAKADAIIMHPGPINRGVEIASDVADGPFSVILDQVAAGVAVRMAILYLLLGV